MVLTLDASASRKTSNDLLILAARWAMLERGRTKEGTEGGDGLVILRIRGDGVTILTGFSTSSGTPMRGHVPILSVFGAATQA